MMMIILIKIQFNQSLYVFSVKNLGMQLLIALRKNQIQQIIVILTNYLTTIKDHKNLIQIIIVIQIFIVISTKNLSKVIKKPQSQKDKEKTMLIKTKSYIVSIVKKQVIHQLNALKIIIVVLSKMSKMQKRKSRRRYINAIYVINKVISHQIAHKKRIRIKNER